jgi:hypothetical protein
MTAVPATEELTVAECVTRAIDILLYAHGAGSFAEALLSVNDPITPLV